MIERVLSNHFYVALRYLRIFTDQWTTGAPYAVRVTGDGSGDNRALTVNNCQKFGF